ncbi:hypothetical protein EVJ58_g10525, partial [Rhodofomes roseus]
MPIPKINAASWSIVCYGEHGPAIPDHPLPNAPVFFLRLRSGKQRGWTATSCFVWTRDAGLWIDRSKLGKKKRRAVLDSDFDMSPEEVAGLRELHKAIGRAPAVRRPRKLLILETPLLGQHIPQLVQFLLTCGANSTFESELRVLALNALNWTVQYKKSKVQAHNLAPAILEDLLSITTEPEPEDADEDAPSRSALRIVDCLATNLPPTQVFPPLWNLISQY